jgi:Endonuclease/Exonuclease/phosphatase family
MLTFLFWNLKGHNVNLLANLVHAHEVDVLILAECPMLPATVLTALNRQTATFFYVLGDCAKLQLYTRFSDEYVLPVKRQDQQPLRGDDFSIRRLALPGRDEVLLCAVHFPSKLRQNPIDQTMYAIPFARLLAEAEDLAANARTVLVGDLNMNPYEDGVVTTMGLHGVMSRWIARKETRTVKFASNLYFYNPMWAHFGERHEGHAGTFYYRTPRARADFWNIYDQVLVRPSLLPFFRDEEVAILHYDAVGGVSLLADNGIPDAKNASDHLPVVFRLHI